MAKPNRKPQRRKPKPAETLPGYPEGVGGVKPADMPRKPDLPRSFGVGQGPGPRSTDDTPS